MVALTFQLSFEIFEKGSMSILKFDKKIKKISSFFPETKTYLFFLTLNFNQISAEGKLILKLRRLSE